jgi:fatty acid desaturase
LSDLLTTTPLRKTGASEYTALSQAIKEQNLLKRTVSFYIKNFIFWAAIVAGTVIAMFFIGDNWWQLFAAGVLGIALTQIAFLAHETSHRQVFNSNKVNDWAGLILANLFSGFSYNWWMTKHTRHHANPNNIGKDPDMNIRVLSFTAKAAREKTGIMKWVARRQGWLLFPVFTLTAFDLMASSATLLFAKTNVKKRPIEIALFLSHYVLLGSLAFFLLNPGIAGVFVAVQIMTFGLYMGMSFAPNHKGMPVLPTDSKVDFLRRQVLTSRNIRGNWFTDNFMGGLNYQIEHHLFPSMPRPHLRRAQRIVKQYCADKNISYMETSLPNSYRKVIEYLNEVGIEGTDPFDCPMISEYRRRD